MSKKNSWRKQRDIHNAFSRELEQLAAQSKRPIVTCALPPRPPLTRRDKRAAERAAEREQQLQRVREVLAAEQAEEQARGAV